MKRADFDKLSFGEAWEGVRHLALLVEAFRAGERDPKDDRRVENFRRRADLADEWLAKHGLRYGAAHSQASGEEATPAT